MADNQRNYFRLEFAHPLCSDVKIIGVNGRELESRKARVCIRDISAGGLRFSTRLSLPEDANLLLEFRFTLLDKNIRAVGVIARKWESGPSLYDYGVNFTMFENDIMELTGLVNLLAIKLKKTPVLSSCSFCTQEELDMLDGIPQVEQEGTR